MPVISADIRAIKKITQKERGESCLSGMVTFIEKILTTRVGSIITMVKMVRALMRMLRLLLIIEARASIRLARTCENIPI